MKYFWIGLLILLVLFPDAWHLPLQPTATPRGRPDRASAGL